MLTFRNSGFPDSLEWDKWYEAKFEGWLELTLALKRVLEKGSIVEMNVADEA